MAARDSKSFGSKSLIAMLFISVVVGVTLLAATARAEDCLAAPNSPAREGTRWYYRLDRASQHKCWYMRAPDQPAQQAAAPAKTALPAPRLAIPVPRPRPLDASAASLLRPGDTDQSSSQAEGIAAKPSATAQVGRSTAETTSSIPKESTSQQAGTSLAAPAPSATPLIGAASEITSAISEMHQVPPSLETNAAVTAPAPDAEPPIGATTDEISSPTSDIPASQRAATSSDPDAQVATSGPNAAPQIITPMDDAVSSIPKDSTTPHSTSSDLRSNDAEPAPDVFVAQPHAPLAAATVNAHPIPPDALADSVSDGRERTALTDEPVDNARMRVRPLYLILAFVVALVVMSYYVVFRYFLGGSAQISADHPEEDSIDDQYNSPEFYRKLRQGAAFEKS
jgi:hypothetical protein